MQFIDVMQQQYGDSMMKFDIYLRPYSHETFSFTQYCKKRYFNKKTLMSRGFQCLTKVSS